MKIGRIFGKDGWCSRKWNSHWVGAPLWIIAVGLTYYWAFHLPTPGKAIGALAVVAGIMSVREMKILGKISWVALLIFMLVIEFRAIDKDHEENDRKQREFFAAQKQGFQDVTIKQIATSQTLQTN